MINSLMLDWENANFESNFNLSLLHKKNRTPGMESLEVRLYGTTSVSTEGIIKRIGETWNKLKLKVARGFDKVFGALNTLLSKVGLLSKRQKAALADVKAGKMSASQAQLPISGKTVGRTIKYVVFVAGAVAAFIAARQKAGEALQGANKINREVANEWKRTNKGKGEELLAEIDKQFKSIKDDAQRDRSMFAKIGDAIKGKKRSTLTATQAFKGQGHPATAQEGAQLVGAIMQSGEKIQNILDTSGKSTLNKLQSMVKGETGKKVAADGGAAIGLFSLGAILSIRVVWGVVKAFFRVIKLAFGKLVKGIFGVKRDKGN